MNLQRLVAVAVSRTLVLVTIPLVAVAQAAAGDQRTPLAWIWYLVGLVLLAALVWLLFAKPRAKAAARADAHRKVRA